MRHIHQTLVVILLGTLLFSCKKEEPVAENIYVVSGTAVSESNRAAHAVIYGGFNAANNKLAFNINWYNLSSQPTGASFRIGSSQLVKQLPVTEGGTNGLSAGDMTLTSEQASQLMGGKLLYSVTTVNHPEGEIIGNMEISSER